MGSRRPWVSFPVRLVRLLSPWFRSGLRGIAFVVADDDFLQLRSDDINGGLVDGVGEIVVAGFLVLEKLRRTHAVPIRVIMITANEGSRHKAYAEMLGVDDYIRKPFGMDRLVESIQRLLGD